MSAQQFHETVQQWQELEAAGQEEAEARRVEDANEILQEMRAGLDDEFREALEDRFPMLRAWPGKASK